ncbi:AAA family ATPase [Dyella jiangningensis]|uniref:ATPase dynein-related AAA domain-containing protein n=1 Tax=Dyella jiangningensis TaxID=1379159 RepID=A0A328P0M4_9GAMM|nr:AAA family ATPase [Dyella jiangningensis]RAO74923.1 hypothetical protein CA260_19170 [Dyella jiangningensis]
MALVAPGYDYSAVLTAAKEWIARCLVNDGSMFFGQALWTADNFQALHVHYVQRLDTGEGSFLGKLHAQLNDAPPDAKLLMAEIYWAMQLFPNNSLPETKAAQIRQIASWADETIELDCRWLEKDVLAGIGSSGPGYSTHFWRELVFVIRLCQRLKSLEQGERVSLFERYDALADLLADETRSDDRQFRHMMRFFAFPERVERMSSNRNRIDVLAAFGVADRRAISGWSDVDLDNALLDLRMRLGEELGTQVLDFYDPPLISRWKPDIPQPNDPEPEVNEDTAAYDSSAAHLGSPVNLILFGPPGTGKTRHIEGLKALYSDTLADVDRPDWLRGLVNDMGWLPVFAAALAHLAQPSTARDIAGAELCVAKAAPSLRRPRQVPPPVAIYLQEHASASLQSAPSVTRRAPAIFDRSDDGRWFLVENWRELSPESAALFDAWQQGPQPGASALRRYRMVTFHPSYGYEDFIEGIRPVEDETGQVAFRLVDGVFKQLCEQAAKNPRHRYAMFIDEINRANISKVFGELITLIELDKRITVDDQGSIAGSTVYLPGSQRHFGVPSNVDIYGTMNTADRSIALMDVALRRRFTFREMSPSYDVLGITRDGIDLSRLLKIVNARIQYLLDREHCLGHGYLTSVDAADGLARMFAFQIIPLLQEYFFDDWSKIRLILSGVNGDCPFLVDETTRATELFPGVSVNELPIQQTRYRVTDPDTWTVAHFVSLYA